MEKNSSTNLSKEKNLSDMAQYLKNLLPTEIPADYSIKPIFTNIEVEENIRNGILALKDFMSLFYGLLIEDSERYEKPKSTNDKTDRNPSLAVDFPFIYHVKSVLLNIGYHSVLNGGVLTLSGLKNLTPIICSEGMEASSKISVPKLMGCLNFLNECGMYFDGLELDDVKSYMAGERLVEITYPDNPAALTGLKIMAVAQRDILWKTNDEIFLRCDYRALSNDIPDVTDALKTFISPFSQETRDFILHLNQKCQEKGLNCTVKNGLKNSFLYSHKKCAMLELSSSFASGYRIFIKAPSKHLYNDKTAAFQEILNNGAGCEGKKLHKPCDDGCCGFYLPLDDSILGFSKNIEELIIEILRGVTAK